MSKLIVLAIVLASLAAILACSRDDATPPSQSTAQATNNPRPAETETPQDENSKSAQGLTPLNIDDPQKFLSGLSGKEQSCLSEYNLGTAQIMAAMTSTAAIAEGDAIIDCLEDETVLRLFLSESLTASGELSAETASCIRESLGGMNLRPMMKSTGTDAGSIDDKIAAMASFLTFTACLNDEEWQAAAPALELGPRDKSGTDCLLAELGGSTGVAKVLLRTDESGLPREFIGAAAKCGVGFAGMVENMPADSGSGGIGGDSSTEGSGPQTDTLHPVPVDDPEAFLAGLSPREQSCLSDRAITRQDLLQMISPSSSPETNEVIINCLRDDTVLRVILTPLVGQSKPFSPATSACIREGFVPIDLRSLLSSPADTASRANALAISMAALNVAVACMNDNEWTLYAPRLGMDSSDRGQAVCLLKEMGGAEGLVGAVRDAELGNASDTLTGALHACDTESNRPHSTPFPQPTPYPTVTPVPPTPTATPTPSQTETPIPTQAAKSYAPQPHIMLRVVLVTEDWTPFAGRGGWMSAVSQRESASLKFYEAAIWEEIDAVHLYAFTNDFDPYFGSGDSATPEEIIANREKHAIKKTAGLPERDTRERSAFLREVFEEFAAVLVKRHPDAQHHLMFSGHGGPSGDLFSGQLANADADSFLGTWARLLGSKLGVIDMGGPCNKGSYVDLDNFCKHARYYVASDLPNGGFVMDEWDVDKYNETDAETQYHHILAESATLEDALKARIGLRRTLYEYSRNNQTENKVQQSNYVYSCPAFADFRQAFETFVKETDVAYPQWDLYDTMVTYDAPPALLEKFSKVIVHSVDNRDFFEWSSRSNGIISPLDLFYRVGR